MTWTKLSDDFGDDCWTLSDAAFRLHVEGLGWSNRKLLDCQLSAEDVQRFAKNPDAVTELTDCGWWSHDTETETFIIRHHAGYQRLAADVVRQQEVNKANRRRGRARPVRTHADEPSEEPSQGDESSNEPSDERDGTGRDGTGSVPATQLETTTQREKELHAHAQAREAGCTECQRRSVFHSGACPVHEQRQAS